MKLLPTIALALVTFTTGATPAGAQRWQPLRNQPTSPVGSMLLLTDGTVLVHEEPRNGQNWYKLTPDINGSYIRGTWTKAASLPNGYGPLFFRHAGLPGGRR